jgi:hypothetical protein
MEWSEIGCLRCDKFSRLVSRLFKPLLNFEWVVWRVKGGLEPGAANP